MELLAALGRTEGHGFMRICSDLGNAIRNSLVAVDRATRRVAPLRAVLRRRLACLLVALYVVAVHGLPALHLLWHHNDHVHTLGGLHWLRHALPHHDLPRHEHGSLTLPLPSTSPSDALASLPSPLQSLRASSDLHPDGVAPHLGGGLAHGQHSFLAPVALSAAPLHARAVLLTSWLATLAAHAVVAAPRARAPPALL